MDERFIEFETTDDVLDDVINRKLVVPGNKLILEHNQLALDVVSVDQKVDDLITVSATPPAVPKANTYWYKVI